MYGLSLLNIFLKFSWKNVFFLEVLTHFDNIELYICQWIRPFGFNSAGKFKDCSFKPKEHSLLRDRWDSVVWKWRLYTKKTCPADLRVSQEPQRSRWASSSSLSVNTKECHGETTALVSQSSTSFCTLPHLLFFNQAYCACVFRQVPWKHHLRLTK